MKNNIGKRVIVRGDRSGVEYGTLVSYKGQEVPDLTYECEGSVFEGKFECITRPCLEDPDNPIK